MTDTNGANEADNADKPHRARGAQENSVAGEETGTRRNSSIVSCRGLGIRNDTVDDWPQPRIGRPITGEIECGIIAQPWLRTKEPQFGEAKSSMEMGEKEKGSLWRSRNSSGLGLSHPRDENYILTQTQQHRNTQAAKPGIATAGNVSSGGGVSVRSNLTTGAEPASSPSPARRMKRATTTVVRGSPRQRSPHMVMRSVDCLEKLEHLHEREHEERVTARTDFSTNASSSNSNRVGGEGAGQQKAGVIDGMKSCTSTFSPSDQEEGGGIEPSIERTEATASKGSEDGASCRQDRLPLDFSSSDSNAGGSGVSGCDEILLSSEPLGEGTAGSPCSVEEQGLGGNHSRKEKVSHSISHALNS